MKNKMLIIGISALLIMPLTAYSQENESSGEDDGGAVKVPDKKKPESICYSKSAQAVENFANNLFSNVCANINTNPDVSNSKFAYKNPDGGCDIGLEMPGLPSFGASLAGIDSCQIVKAVTGDMVDKFNDKVTGGWNRAIDGAKGKILEETGLDVDNLNFDMGDIAEDAIKGGSIQDSVTSN